MLRFFFAHQKIKREPCKCILVVLLPRISVAHNRKWGGAYHFSICLLLFLFILNFIFSFRTRTDHRCPHTWVKVCGKLTHSLTYSTERNRPLTHLVCLSIDEQRTPNIPSTANMHAQENEIWAENERPNEEMKEK